MKRSPADKTGPELARRAPLIAGRYRIETMIGSGGMGALYRARHMELDVDVAIKFMHSSLADASVGRARFRAEARAAARLKSPHIVAVYDYDVFEGRPYIVMELLEGEDLGAAIARELCLSPRRTCEIVSQVARALSVAHRAGIVHRDLKPSNLFLTRDVHTDLVKVLDFGIAKRTNGEALDETTGQLLLGSPLYFSPEQARGADVDARSDLFSLAVVAYECLVGRPPFTGENVGDLIVKICSEDPLPPSRLAPSLTPAIDRFFAQALARPKRDRFSDAEEFAEAFVRALGVVRSPSAAPERAAHTPKGDAGASRAYPPGRLDETEAFSKTLSARAAGSITEVRLKRRFAGVAAGLLAIGASAWFALGATVGPWRGPPSPPRGASALPPARASASAGTVEVRSASAVEAGMVRAPEQASPVRRRTASRVSQASQSVAPPSVSSRPPASSLFIDDVFGVPVTRPRDE